MTSTIKRAATE